MTSRFDPYQQWLNIPPQEQPPDHYRLLGIARFESDAAVIQAAVEARMTQVRSYQTGPRASYTQLLLNELATAKIRLLNPVAKREYDAALADACNLSGTYFSADLLPPTLDVAPRVVNAVFTEPPPRPRSGVRTAEFPLAPPLVSPHRRDYDPHLFGWWLPMLLVTGMLIAGPAMWLWFRVPRQPPSVGTLPPRAGEDVPAAEEVASQPVRIGQEGNGNVNFPVSLARLTGQIVLRTEGIDSALEGWASDEDAAEWFFKLVRLPPRGLFRWRVVYACEAVENGAQYVLTVDGDVRTRDLQSGASGVTDEFLITIPRSGEHQITLRLRGHPRGFRLRAMECEFVQPSPDSP